MPKFGLYKATVVDNIDIENMGRIKVQITEPDTIPMENLPFANYCSPFGGSYDSEGAGFFFVPEKDDVVWVMFEGGNVSRPVYLGASFRTGLSASHIPIEAKENMMPPSNRVIKTKTGHRIEMDDRLQDSQGTNPRGIRITTGGERGLHFIDATNEVILFNGQPYNHELYMNKNGIRLSTKSKVGLTLNEQLNSILLSNKNGQTTLSLTDTAMTLYADETIIMSTNGFLMESNGSIEHNTDGGYKVTCGDYRMVSGSDISTISGNNTYHTAANNHIFTAGGNFIVDLPVPGVPNTSGMCLINSTLGQIILRTGPKIPNPTGIPLDFIPIDPMLPDPTSIGRIGIGTLGDCRMESAGGGISIYSIPRPLPGACLLPRTGIPVQPAIMGLNLYAFLTEFLLALQMFVMTNTAMAATYTTTAVGPGVLNAVPAWVAFQTMLTQMQTKYMGAPSPLGILSSTTYLDN